MADEAVEGTSDTLRRPGSRGEALRAPSSAWLRPALHGGAYAVCWALAFVLSDPLWYLPAGLRFAVFWLAPSRRWPVWIGAEAAAGGALLVAGVLASPSAWVLAALLPAPLCALGIRLARPRGVYAAPESPARMGATLGAMLLVAALEAALRLLPAGPDDELGRGTAALHALVGAYVGMLILAPILFQAFQRGAPHTDRRRLLIDLGWIVLPLLVALAVLLYWRSAAALLAASLALLPLMLMGFRHGWRGAAWAISLTGVALHLAWLNAEPSPFPRESVPLLVALIGSVALLLGAAIGAMLRANTALIERNRLDQQANARLAAQTEALADLSRRLVRAREDEQRRLAHELHDEVGQSVAALGTRLSLLLRRTDDPELVAVLNTQRELVQRVQASIREVLQGLRPAVLDRFGLEAALREGPIHRMLADAGVEYLPECSGPLAQVGPDTASAVYRICQEAATNCVRHARARRFQVRLDVAPIWAGDLEVHLRIEDDGRGFDAHAAQAESLRGGLRGIHDRVMALGGDYSCESGPEGTRHLVWFVERGTVAGSVAPIRSS